MGYECVRKISEKETDKVLHRSSEITELVLFNVRFTRAYKDKGRALSGTDG